MATKPSTSDVFSWSTDTNFTSGPASGNPTKVDPTGWPTVLQGFIPATGIAAEYVNRALNALGTWTSWLNSGSSAGAADAHIVETDSAGDAGVQNLNVTDQEVHFTDNTGLEALIARDQQTGTGGAAGGSIRVRAAEGQAQSGANPNNDGGNFVFEVGPGGGGGNTVAKPGYFERAWEMRDAAGANTNDVQERTRAYRDDNATGTPVLGTVLEAYALATHECLFFEVLVLNVTPGAGTHAVTREIGSVSWNGATYATSAFSTLPTGGTPLMSIDTSGGSGLVNLKYDLPANSYSIMTYKVTRIT